MQKKRMYWIVQLCGWLLYFSVNFFFFYKPTLKDALFHVLLIPSVMALTHGFRYFIIKKGWLQKNIAAQIIIVALCSLLLSFLFLVIQWVFNILVFGASGGLTMVSFFTSLFNFWFVFFVWGILYFSFHYVVNYRKTEIEQLKMQAALKEAELHKLKMQLNPHFMFNAMNSIRALVDENPQKAKQAVTQLANILRQTLNLEKNKVIPFSDEINLVHDYLSLEKTRYENRLLYSFDISDEAYSYKIPPMILQTLVENAVKHGISKLTEGGTISIRAKQLADKKLQIQILNSGMYVEGGERPASGYGIQNSRSRLQLVFGAEADLFITNESGKVQTLITLPLTI
ncbi:MAG: histidine kinase [Bacteroidetes bacterium]|nr:histidine kinase [Bacteroidota bacterium]